MSSATEPLPHEQARRWRVLPGVTDRQLATVALFAVAIVAAALLVVAIVLVAAPGDPHQVWHAGLTVLTIFGLAAVAGLAGLAWLGLRRLAIPASQRAQQRQLDQVVVQLRRDMNQARTVLDRCEAATDQQQWCA